MIKQISFLLVLSASVLLLNRCKSVEISKKASLIYQTVYITHDSICKKINTVIQGLDRNFEFKDVVLNGNKLIGRLTPISKVNEVRIPVYYIYALDYNSCLFELIGETTVSGNFQINIGNKKAFAFTRFKLGMDSDEYCDCIFLNEK